MNHHTKTARNIRPGDNIVTKSGEVVRITEIGPGMPRNTAMLSWSGGWSCPDKDAEIIVTEMQR